MTDKAVGQICETCPMATALEVATELILQNDHNDKDRALGGIALTENVLQGVAKRQNCPGPSQGSNEQVVCPLHDLAMTARSMATAPWPHTSYNVKLEDFYNKSSERKEKSTGQYL